MSKIITFDAAILNIRTQPNTPEGYVSLFKKVYDEEIYVPYFGDMNGMLGTMNYFNPEEQLDGFYGYLFSFTDIKPDAEWINLARKEAATSEEVKQHVSIPPDFKANSKRVPYIFLPKKHRMFFMTRFGRNTFGASSSERLMIKLLEKGLQLVENNKSTLDITIEQSSETLKQILNLHELQHLRIEVKLDNADGPPKDLSERLLKNQREINARKAALEYDSLRGKSLVVNEDVEAYANAALSNGYVEGNGKDSKGIRRKYNTKSHPRKIKAIVCERETIFDALKRKAIEFINTIQ